MVDFKNFTSTRTSANFLINEEQIKNNSGRASQKIGIAKFKPALHGYRTNKLSQNSFAPPKIYPKIVKASMILFLYPTQIFVGEDQNFFTTNICTVFQEIFYFRNLMFVEVTKDGSAPNVKEQNCIKKVTHRGTELYLAATKATKTVINWIASTCRGSKLVAGLNVNYQSFHYGIYSSSIDRVWAFGFELI